MPTWNRLHTAASATATRLRQEAGQALVEFAVVLPVLMLVILGIIYFGRYESYSNQMTQLAEQGARQAAVAFVATTTPNNGATCSGAPTTASIACFVQNLATGELAQGSSDVGKVNVWVDCNPGNSDNTCNSGENVEVCLQTPVQFPLVGMRAGAVFQSATMRVESTAATPIINSYTPGSSSTYPC